MQKKLFSGIIPPLITSFDKQGNIDEKTMRNLTRWLANHVQGFYPCGTYGSGPLLTTEERKLVARIVNEEKGNAFAIIHVGAATTTEAIDLAKHAEEIGSDAIGAIPPYYYHYTQEQLVDHYKALIDAVKIPVFLYNNPDLSNNPVAPQTLSVLADYGLAGVKDSAFDLVSFYNYKLAVTRPDFQFIIGTEAIAAGALDVGACGVIAGLANCFPEFMTDFYKTWKAGDPLETGKKQLAVVKARNIIKMAQTLTMIYAILKMRGINPGYPRSPFKDISKETYDKARKMIDEQGILA
ncbi:dihydrodipicolinate synthase family protein [Sediminispirochaeta smaragdinae]|uniref:Dihydrodipicolinate synthetase n=1 Tax=Sediminispirochaeta smaragdinae (strain DSM 11293 / JCM 15392 / SEBR 4228) TaxID=573413 RepID=E1RB43_SEDSS|nr:dihydrodipicolinate synthase family protein [Sediminispirochaeta smaragdinae]ADK79573.1 dihydrodipicolinate synthetase [Sediminispirochaeta smaragdinae DSM 11293]